MKLFSDPKYVAKFPMIATLFLEWANVNQMMRMFREQTAAGQSLIAWLSVNVALWLFARFYFVCTPNEKWAQRSIIVGLGLNTLVIFTVVYFRFIA